MKTREIFTGNGYIELYQNKTTDKKNLKFKILFAKKYLIYHKNEKIVIFKDLTISPVGDNLYFQKGDTFLFTLPTSSIKRVVGYYENKYHTLFWNEQYGEKENSTLCGNKFRGEYLVIANPKDLAFGEIIERKCENCFFRPMRKNAKRCNILTGKGNMRPRTLFRRRKNEPMKPILDGKEVAQYCKYFAHPDCE